MTPTIGYQLTAPLVRACPANAATSAFTAKTAATTTRPSGNLVYDLAPVLGAGAGFRARVRVFPIGVGAANDAFSLRVWGWSRIGSGDAPGTLWVPAELGEYACTLGAFTGVAGSPVLATELFADTITVVKEPTTVADTTNGGTTEIMSPVNDQPAWLELRLRGVELLEFDFDQTTNTPTMNCLLQFLGGEK